MLHFLGRHILNFVVHASFSSHIRWSINVCLKSWYITIATISMISIFAVYHYYCRYHCCDFNADFGCPLDGINIDLNLNLNLNPELQFLCESHQPWYWSCSRYRSFYASLPQSRNLSLRIRLSINHIVDTWTHILCLDYAQPLDKYAPSHS